MGFIAEDVPELVATKDRKGMSPMDVTAVLTKVVQEQQKIVEQQQHAIVFNYPQNLLISLKWSEKEFEKEFKTSAVIKMYERGKISSGIASQLLQMSRVDFLNMLCDYKVSYLGV